MFKTVLLPNLKTNPKTNQTLTLNKGQFSSEAIVWIPTRTFIKLDFHTLLGNWKSKLISIKWLSRGKVKHELRVQIYD